MKNIISSPAATETTSVQPTVTEPTAGTTTAVLDAPVATAAPTTKKPRKGNKAAASVVHSLVELAALVMGVKVIEYTREELLAARLFILTAKRTAKQQGFGAIMGRFIRDTVGYKFDSMNVMDVLRNMAQADFLTRYAATADKWLTGVKSDDSDTGKANKLAHKAAMALVNDQASYVKLVKSLLILCQRNQSWQESGSELALPYNGHKAMLDLFGINVTNARRLKLSAN